MRSRKDQTLNPVIAALAMFVVASLVPALATAGTWVDHITKIPALKRETEALEAEIKHLIHEKRETHDEAHVKSITDTIAEKYKALKEAGEKLETETTHVRFKHPEQADKLDRQYVRFKAKSLGDLESEVGIDGKLDRIRRQVLATFPVPVVEEKPTTPKINSFFIRTPASVEDAEMPEKITLKK